MAWFQDKIGTIILIVFGVHLLLLQQVKREKWKILTYFVLVGRSIIYI